MFIIQVTYLKPLAEVDRDCGIPQDYRRGIR